MKPSTSLRRAGGLDPQPARAIRSCSCPAYRDSRKNQFSSATSCGRVPCSGHGPPAARPAYRTARSRRSTGPRSCLQVQVTAVRAGPPQPLDPGPVPRVAAGADEVIEGQRERLAQRGERRGVAADQLAAGNPSASAASTFFSELSSVPVWKPDLVADRAGGAGPARRPGPARARARGGPGVDIRDRGAEVNACCGHRNLLGQGGAPTRRHRIEAPRGLVDVVLAASSGPASGASSRSDNEVMLPCYPLARRASASAAALRRY